MKYDGQEFEPTAGFDLAVKTLMKEVILMMREVHPDCRSCWVIGVCYLKDLSEANGMHIMYGGYDDKGYLSEGADYIIEVPL